MLLSDESSELELESSDELSSMLPPMNDVFELCPVATEDVSLVVS